MTAREFVTKHYGSLSAGVFAIGLLLVLGAYGGGFSATSGAPTTTVPPDAQQVQPPANVSPREAVPEEEPAADENTKAKDETAEPDNDPLEEAMAKEEEKAAERREQIREEINKDREAAGLPPLAVPSE